MDEDNTSKNIKNSFIKHVFNFDNDTKCELLNTGQYALLAIIPMGFYNYIVDSVIPEVDESKSNLEILTEVIGQVLLLLAGFFLLHRLITYVPTYSGRAFGEMNIFSIILLLLALSYDSHTKIGEKTKILMNRLKDIWDGNKKDDKRDAKKKDGSVVKVTQPISKAGMPTHAPSRADYLGSHNAMSSPTQMLPPQNQATSNDMYNDAGSQGLQDANSPVPDMVPMAANDGYGAFGSAF
tara:strand:- start:1190 stop:1903 length:714 start_codon:yes stop_codon:yes gene_type:complete